MTITEPKLDTKYADWFRGKRNTVQAKREILQQFSTEPDDGHQWTEQDICEQYRKIIRHWDRWPDN